MVDFVNKYSKEKQKKDFVITNQGIVNPINDDTNMNDFIKPINLNDLMKLDMYSFDNDNKSKEHSDPNDGK